MVGLTPTLALAEVLERVVVPMAVAAATTRFDQNIYKSM